MILRLSYSHLTCIINVLVAGASPIGAVRSETLPSDKRPKALDTSNFQIAAEGGGRSSLNTGTGSIITDLSGVAEDSITFKYHRLSGKCSKALTDFHKLEQGSLLYNAERRIHTTLVQNVSLMIPYSSLY